MDQPIPTPFVSPDPSAKAEPSAPELPHKSRLPLILLILLFLILVSVVGYFTYQKFQPARSLLAGPSPSPFVSPNPNPNPNPTALPAEALVEAETANWQTYTNEKYNFSFKYPAGLTVEQVSHEPYEQYKLVYMGQKQKDSGRTQTSLFDGYIFYVSVRGTDSVAKITQDTFNGSKQNCPDQTKWSAITDSSINGIKSKTYTVTDCLGDYTENFISNGKVTFEITQSYVGDLPEYKQYKETTNLILSTFKFID